MFNLITPAVDFSVCWERETVLAAGIDGDLKSELKQVGQVNQVRQARHLKQVRQVRL
jgi:hypothetical protein